MIEKLNVRIKYFKDFLCNNGDLIVQIKEESDSSFSDWLQANWELIVESSLLVNSKYNTLEVYGDGADANGASSRILYPSLLPNKKIICIPKNIGIIDYLNKKEITDEILEFDRFVSIKEGWYYEELPFDMILTNYCNKEFVVNYHDVEFKLIDV